MLSKIHLFAKISLLFVFLVVIAGSVVRMTGSGMGCPDWPKCFGYLIPPTEETQVLWAPGKSFEKGQMIVHEEALWKANESFTTSSQIDLSNWTKYDKHDYAIFNASHTWTEYINRLVGALTGIPVLLLFLFSTIYSFRSRQWSFFLLSGATLFFLGFEAWLGKMVVDGNLIPGQISIHMAGAAVLIILLLILIQRSSGMPRMFAVDGKTRWILILVVTLSILQIFLGTQVREAVDVIAKAGVISRDSWVANLPSIFKVHRSFSIVIVLLNGWLIWKLFKHNPDRKTPHWLALVLLLEVVAGIVLAYAGMPAALQPTHLFAAMILMSVQFYILLRVSRVSA